MDGLIRAVLDPGAKIPERAHPDDAGLDLFSRDDVIIPKGGSFTFDTGVHLEIPKGYFGKVESKSGLNVKYGIVSLGGVIDSGYTGSICVKLYNFGIGDYYFVRGEKIAQLIIQSYADFGIMEAEELEKTERGDNGFGSTGR